MARRIVDISIPLEADVASDPPVALPKIQYMRHDQTIERIAGFFPGPAGERPAGRRRLGAGEGRNHNP